MSRREQTVSQELTKAILTSPSGCRIDVNILFQSLITINFRLRHGGPCNCREHSDDHQETVNDEALATHVRSFRQIGAPTMAIMFAVLKLGATGILEPQHELPWDNERKVWITLSDPRPSHNPLTRLMRVFF